MKETPEILVVDDSRIVIAIVTDVLEGEGYRVRCAENGRVALEMVAERRPALMLLDVMMPEMDGYQVCERLRQDSEYVPVLMLTAKGDLEDLVRGLEVGADDYISKPFDQVELLARVKSLLRISSLQKRLYRQNMELEAKNEQLEALASQLDALNQELKLLSVTDGLTKTYNHRHFQERFKGEIARARRYHEPLSCVMIDIDHFKDVNDTFGHLVGDQVLVRLVEILKGGIRGEDLVARYGGEEFVLLLPNTPSGQAAHMAERLREQVEAERLQSTAGEIRFTISLGVADYRPENGAVEPDSLLGSADRALYRAKDDGRNRVVVA